MASSVPDFASRRFQSAAAHYLAGRPPYPPHLIKRTAQLLELRDYDRVLDLGCGPAQLAVAFAPLVREVVAMDPEPEMLALARQELKASRNVKVVAGSSANLGDQLGSFRAVLIGRAFHWMDRADTLRRFESLVMPDGAVVLFGNDRDAAPTSDWGQAYREIIARYAEDDDTRRHRSGGVRAHVSILMESAFNRLEQITIISNWSFGSEVLIERALSMSSTSRARLGERADEMVAELQAAIPTWSQDGTFTEILASTALIARRRPSLINAVTAPRAGHDQQLRLQDPGRPTGELAPRAERAGAVRHKRHRTQHRVSAENESGVASALAPHGIMASSYRLAPFAVAWFDQSDGNSRTLLHDALMSSRPCYPSDTSTGER